MLNPTGFSPAKPAIKSGDSPNCDPSVLSKLRGDRVKTFRQVLCRDRRVAARRRFRAQINQQHLCAATGQAVRRDVKVCNPFL